MIKLCVQCEHYEPIADGCGMCARDALPVTVLCDYEPTKNFLHCKNEVQMKNKYGEMAYQVDEKTPQEMLEEGWCDGCVQDVHICDVNGRCEGYVKYAEEKK